MYNENKKELFLTNSNIKENTAENYKRLFNVTEKYEEKFKMDISEFSMKQLERIFYDFNANNRNTIESYARIISSYLNWCKDYGFIKKNPLENLKPTDFERYMNEHEEYITEQELKIIEDNCVNFQDKVLLRLLFEGVGGKQLSEITNLKKIDVDFERKELILRETKDVDDKNVPIRFSKRHLEVGDYLLELLDEAMKETRYQKRNGKMLDDSDGRIREHTDLINNDYVIRPSITKTETFITPCDKFVIYRRLTVIAETLNVPKLTAKFVQRSGMVHYANTLNSDGLSIVDLKDVAERFNVKSYHNLKGFLKMKNKEE